MVLHDTELHDLGWRTEADHDPSEPLREYVTLRDRTCDGPSGTRTSARHCELDHDSPHPDGPTAAWNLAARWTSPRKVDRSRCLSGSVSCGVLELQRGLHAEG